MYVKKVALPVIPKSIHTSWEALDNSQAACQWYSHYKSSLLYHLSWTKWSCWTLWGKTLFSAGLSGEAAGLVYSVLYIFSLDWKAIYHQNFFSSSKSMICTLSPKFIILMLSLSAFSLSLCILLFFNHCCGSSLGTLHFLFRSLLNGKNKSGGILEAIEATAQCRSSWPSHWLVSLGWCRVYWLQHLALPSC